MVSKIQIKLGLNKFPVVFFAIRRPQGHNYLLLQCHHLHNITSSLNCKSAQKPEGYILTRKITILMNNFCKQLLPIFGNKVFHCLLCIINLCFNLCIAIGSFQGNLFRSAPTMKKSVSNQCHSKPFFQISLNFPAVLSVQISILVFFILFTIIKRAS